MLIRFNIIVKMDRHELINDMRDECECQDCKYCPLEVLIIADDRTLEQHKLVERFKHLKSEKLNRDLGWDEAYLFWVNEGYAKRFADIYENGYTHKQLEERMEKTT